MILLWKLFEHDDSYLTKLLTRDILAIESSLTGSVYWLHDLNDRLGKPAGQLLSEADGVTRALRLLNGMLTTAEATIELGYLNSVRERHTR